MTTPEAAPQHTPGPCEQIIARGAIRYTDDWRQGLKDAREQDAINSDLLAALEAYERWEADLILDAECWTDGLPRMTQECYDRFIEIQSQRNAAIARARGGQQ